MPDFLYRAKTTSGQNAEGVITAASHREALSLLTQQSLFPLEVRDKYRPSALGLKFEWPRRIKTEVIADTLTQLSDLLTNGVTLLESLQIIAEQAPDPAMREVMADVHSAVAQGTNLDEALSAHPQVFSTLTVSMIRAGLEGAFLEEALDRISTFLRKQDDMRGKVIGAMTYPCILAIVGLIVTVVLVVFVVPMFGSLFDRLERSGVGLPLITVILLAVSHALVRYGLLVAVAVVALVILVRRLMLTEKGRRITDQIKLKLPIAGPIFHESAVSRFSRVLGTLLRNGVPILKSLEISSNSAGNVLLQTAIRDSAENISAGSLLSRPLADSGLVPPQVMAMIRVAEEANTLDEVLVKIADRMDQRIERKLDMLVRLIEPLMLLTIGAMVALIIMGVLLPIFDIGSAIG